MRKRAIRAVCKFCDATKNGDWMCWDDERKLGYAKGVICRCAKTENFNRIGIDRLRSIAFSFEKQVQDMDSVVRMAEEIIKGN